jgi:predicted Zn-dependent protease
VLFDHAQALRERFRSLRSTANFWSLRVHAERGEHHAMRQDTLLPPSVSLDRGAMLSVVADGGYGYCATSDLSQGGLQHALERATAWAQATRAKSVIRFDARDMPAPRGEYLGPQGEAPPARSAIHDLLAGECRAARIDARIVERFAAIRVFEDERLYLTNTGGDLLQGFRYTLPYARVTANEGSDTQARSLERALQGGFENVAAAGFRACGARLADEALQLLGAPNCPTGTMDLLLMPDQMMLQIHESIGHPLELDRILGDERNYAGTSFVTPEMFGSYAYGSALLNVTFDPTWREEYASYGWDDEGTHADKVWLIRDGILVAPLGARLSQARAGLPGTANARASNWNRPPIDRMANLNVEPGASTLESMIAAIEDGVLMRTNVSWSIDDARNKFQFGCEWAERIERGRRVGVVKNPNYRGVSATFWRSLKRVGDRSTFELHGASTCGKGEPNQAVHCGHAAPACLFGGVEVFGGG